MDKIRVTVEVPRSVGVSEEELEHDAPVIDEVIRVFGQALIAAGYSISLVQELFEDIDL